MQRHTLIVSTLAALVLSACGGGVHNKSALNQYRSNKAKVAVVSLYVNDYADVLKGNNLSGADVDSLIDKKLTEMLALTETKLGTQFTLMQATEFTGNNDYHQLKSGTAFEVFRPKFDGKAMLIFADSRGDLIKSKMTPDRAKQLCTTLGVDMIAVVYSEWGTRTGGIVPTTKPLTKNVLSIYDKSGEQLYQARHNSVGGRNVGAFGKTGITENTIQAWVEAYDKSLQFLVDGL